MKELAVEFLLKELKKNSGVEVYLNGMKKPIEQAKEMEKQQIIDAYETGDKYKFEAPAEQYYNETYKK